MRDDPILCPFCNQPFEFAPCDIEFPDGDVLIKHDNGDCPMFSEGEDGYIWDRDLLVAALKKRPIEDALCAENERLRQALAWYANKNNYHGAAPGIPHETISMFWIPDYGERAREALKENNDGH